MITNGNRSWQTMVLRGYNH